MISYERRNAFYLWIYRLSDAVARWAYDRRRCLNCGRHFYEAPCIGQINTTEATDDIHR